MKTTSFRNGQTVLARPIREENTPLVVGTRKLKNGLMVFDVPADAPKLTTEMVRKLENEAV